MVYFSHLRGDLTDTVKKKLLISTLTVVLLIVVISNACTLVLKPDEPVAIWTPAPVSGAPLIATRSAEILPTLPSPSVTRPLPTPTSTSEASATPLPTAGSTRVPTIAPTPDPKLVVISEDDVLRAMASGGVEQSGLTLEGAAVAFSPDKMVFSAVRLAYGLIEVRNVMLVGRLVATEGRLSLEAESIAPRGLVTALIPSLTNQALAQYTSQWYIEEVRTLDGRLELRIR